MGHVGIALGAKGHRPSVPLWILLVATSAPDITEMILLLAGRTRENDLWSHGLPGLLLVTLGVAVLAALVTRSRRAVLLAALLCLLHVAADLVTGHKVLWPGGPAVGLDLYQWPVVDFLLEMALVGFGWRLYLRTLPPTSRSGCGALVLLVLLLAFQVAFNFVQGIII